MQEVVGSPATLQRVKKHHAERERHRCNDDKRIKIVSLAFFNHGTLRYYTRLSDDFSFHGIEYLIFLYNDKITITPYWIIPLRNIPEKTVVEVPAVEVPIAPGLNTCYKINMRIVRFCGAMLVAVLLSWPAQNVAAPSGGRLNVRIAQSHPTLLFDRTVFKRTNTCIARKTMVCSGACVANCSLTGAIVPDGTVLVLTTRAADILFHISALEDRLRSPDPHPPRPFAIG